MERSGEMHSYVGQGDMCNYSFQTCFASLSLTSYPCVYPGQPSLPLLPTHSPTLTIGGGIFLPKHALCVCVCGWDICLPLEKASRIWACISLPFFLSSCVCCCAQEHIQRRHISAIVESSFNQTDHNSAQCDSNFPRLSATIDITLSASIGLLVYSYSCFWFCLVY